MCAETAIVGSAAALTLAPSAECLVRARRFITGEPYRLHGPWRPWPLGGAVVEDVPAVDGGSAAGRHLWVECLPPGEALTERLAACLATAPAACDSLLLAVFFEDAGEAGRVAADHAAIAAGFRRHPRLFDVIDYVGMQTESGWQLLAYERLNDATADRFPLRVLGVERNLHMDMTREAGRRSDAHLVRYRFASERIPPAARVLDCASGLGYGSALLAREAPARHVTGVDLSDWVIDYASTTFSHGRANLRYLQGDATDLSPFADNSVNAVVSFETIEHLLDPAPFLAHAFRVLADDGLFIGSVPYRWITEGDTGEYHHDWFDARKILALCGRFFSVEELWVQTAGGTGNLHRVRDLRRHEPLGTEPEGDVEWVLIVARKRPAINRSAESWLLLPSSLDELMTMAATLPAWQHAGEPVQVCATSSSWDRVFDRVMADACQALGFAYGGNYPIPAELAVLERSSAYEPDLPPSSDAARARHAARLLAEFPVFQALAGLVVVIPARPGTLADYALLEALQPRQVHLVDSGVQHDEPFRDQVMTDGRRGNPLARFPLEADVACLPWMAVQAATLGQARVVDPSGIAELVTRLSAMPAARALATELASRPSRFAALFVVDPWLRDGLTTSEPWTTFVVHGVRTLLRRCEGDVFVKLPAGTPPHQIDALLEALGEERGGVRVSSLEEAYLPIELFPALAAREEFDVWGGTSMSLPGCATWPGVRVCCVDAEYLESEIRRRVGRFARVQGFARVTLLANDGLLRSDERQRLRRDLLPAPAVQREMLLAERVREADQARMVARARCEAAQQRLEGSEFWSALGRQLLAPAAERRIWIWGSGSAGRRLLRDLRRLHVEPLAFLDSRSADEPREVDGLAVHGVETAAAMAARAAGALVVVASMHASEILQRVRADGDWMSRVHAWNEAWWQLSE